MSRVDILVFGATGYTGREAVAVMPDILKDYSGLTWAVAGRNRSRLESLMHDLGKKTGHDLSSIKIIIADVNDEDSLREMCKQTKVILDFCGPFRFYGEQVVKAAIESQTHYIDVCGETQFIETMQLKYDQQARDAGVYVVSACGFDSIPNDLGVVFLQRNFNGTVNSVESYLSLSAKDQQKDELKNGFINYATWESLIHGLKNAQQLSRIRKQIFSEPLPKLKPKLLSRGIMHKKNDSYCVPFMGCDKSIVHRTQRHLYQTNQQRPIQFLPYVYTGSKLYTYSIMFIGFIMMTFCKWEFTTKLLLMYPRLFSLGYVSKEEPCPSLVEKTEFTMTLYGEGWESGADIENTPPNKKLVAQVSGKNPGYKLTAKAVVLSGLTVLTQRDKLPPTCGVLTTGSAFCNTDLIKNLNRHGMKFELHASE